MTLPLPFALLALQAGGVTQFAPFIFQIAAFFAIFYFILIRPQQQEKKKHEARLMGLKRGDEIVTGGGIVGEVVSIKESLKDGAPIKTLDDRITIKSGESKLVVERGRIARVLGEAATSSPA